MKLVESAGLNRKSGYGAPIGLLHYLHCQKTVCLDTEKQDGHSILKARIGSMAAARRAGTNPAMKAAAESTRIVSPITVGS
jgi:hypothetical protein